MNIKYIAPPKNKMGIKCPYYMKPKYITVHNTANSASARNEVAYMHGNYNYVSYHFAVDDKEIIQALPLNRNAWHAGDGQGAGNRQSIGIEICYSTTGGTKFAKAEKNTAKLVAYLLKKYNLPIDRVRTHKSWSGKYCPHKTLDLGWDRFINLVKKEMGVASTPKPKTVSRKSSGYKLIKENWHFTVGVGKLNVRSAPSTNSSIVATYGKGDVIKYDYYCINNGYVWISYIGGSGIRRYVATGRWRNGRNQKDFGRF